MKKLNFEQMEKLSAGIEMVNAQSGIEITEDPLSKNQQCLLYGLGFITGIPLGLAGWLPGYALGFGGMYAGISKC